jgi:hypothetical protein
VWALLPWTPRWGWALLPWTSRRGWALLPRTTATRDSYDDCDFSSGSEVSTDEEDDRFHGYRKLPLPKGSDLRVKDHGNVYRCLVCPGKADRWFSEESIRGHVVGQGTSAVLRQVYKKKWSRHRVLARNHGWM